MYIPSVAVISTSVVFLYLAYVFYSFWMLVQPPVCQEERLCVYSYLKRNPKLHLSVFTSFIWNPRFNEVTNIYSHWNFEYNKPFEKSLDIYIPYKTRNNGTLFAHIFVSPTYVNDWQRLVQDPETVHVTTSLTKYNIPDTAKVQLLGNSSFVNISTVKPVTHIKKLIPFTMLTESVTFVRTELPGDIYKYFRMKSSNEYLPIVTENFLLDRTGNLVELTTNMSKTKVDLKYDPIGYGKLRFLLHMDLALQAMINLGFKDKELDDIKSLVMDTNFYLLMITVTVCFVHFLFDFLAFKNDIHFWKTRKNLEGLSSRGIMWRATSQIIIFLYLLEEKASILVIIPSFIGVLIEVWKVHKVIPIDWKKLRLKSVTLTKVEKETRQYDAEIMRYLSYLLYPLCFVGALYSLVYDTHRSWYSWLIHNLVNGVYAFGFLFMLPQLFINYKLKSVAHLPWRTFTYKAFNTFIDDMFAFIITMPTAHRLACFRDDVVFLIYMYQRWLYPVDKSRIDVDTAVTEDIPSTKTEDLAKKVQ